MIDIKWIRNNKNLLSESFKKRGQEDLSDIIEFLDNENRNLSTIMQNMQAKRNLIDSDIKQSVIDSSINREELIKKSIFIKKEEETLFHKIKDVSKKLHDILVTIPNILNIDVPEGGEEDSVEIRKHGETVAHEWMVEHTEAAAGYIDIARAVKMSGSRFVILRKDIAKLERALGNWMLDVHCNEFGFEELSVPYILNRNALFGTGQLPKFEHDLFKTCHDKFLIPTSEASLVNLFRNEIIKESDFPIRLTAYTPCFRSECGAAGKDTHGMIRVHQFNKVELVSICHPDKSHAEHEFLTSCAEEILKRLNLSYRMVLLASKDTGATSSKTYDLEVWLPGQKRYREISSASNCLCYQSRRLNMRFKDIDSNQNVSPHTLNCSGVAVGRALIAVIENFQQENGDIIVPQVLLPYMNGKEVIKSYDS